MSVHGWPVAAMPFQIYPETLAGLLLFAVVDRDYGLLPYSPVYLLALPGLLPWWMRVPPEGNRAHAGSQRQRLKTLLLSPRVFAVEPMTRKTFTPAWLLGAWVASAALMALVPVVRRRRTGPWRAGRA